MSGIVCLADILLLLRPVQKRLHCRVSMPRECYRQSCKQLKQLQTTAPLLQLKSGVDDQCPQMASLGVSKTCRSISSLGNDFNTRDGPRDNNHPTKASLWPEHDWRLSVPYQSFMVKMLSNFVRERRLTGPRHTASQSALMSQVVRCTKRLQAQQSEVKAAASEVLMDCLLPSKSRTSMSEIRSIALRYRYGYST